MEFIGNASYYMHTDCAYATALLFIPYKFLVCIMIRFGITKEKEKRRTLLNELGSKARRF